MFVPPGLTLLEKEQVGATNTQSCPPLQQAWGNRSPPEGGQFEALSCVLFWPMYCTVLPKVSTLVYSTILCVLDRWQGGDRETARIATVMAQHEAPFRDTLRKAPTGATSPDASLKDERQLACDPGRMEGQS